jgi:hypothetical protein
LSNGDLQSSKNPVHAKEVKRESFDERFCKEQRDESEKKNARMNNFAI